jgi:hypothetical protein
MLLHGSGADVQLLGDFLVAAAFDQKVQNLFIASRNLDIAEVQHGVSSLLVCETLLRTFLLDVKSITECECRWFAKVSPACTEG